MTQAFGSPAPDPADSPPLVEAVLQRFGPDRPIVVRGPDGRPPEGVGAGVDLAVFHPRLAEVDGRPGWLAAAPGRRRAVFRLPTPTWEETLLSATPAAEASRARNVIPADQYRVEAGVREAVFFLRPGDYVVASEVLAGKERLGMIRV